MASTPWITNDSVMHQVIYSERNSLLMNDINYEEANPKNRNVQHRVREQIPKQTSNRQQQNTGKGRCLFLFTYNKDNRCEIKVASAKTGLQNLDSYRYEMQFQLN